MAEDQVDTTPQQPKKPSPSEKLFKARERLRVEVEQREGEEVAPRKAMMETREPMRVDWEKADRTDELLLADAEELRMKLAQDPDRKDANEIQSRIDVLSESVGRERNTPGDMEARLYGLGFLLERNSELLPPNILAITRRMENPLDYPDYMDAKRALEPALSSLAYELGDPKAREVRNILERRRELRRLTDHFDFTLSGQMSLQEKFSLYLQEGKVFQSIVSKFEEKFEQKKKKGWRGRLTMGVLQGFKGMYSESERASMLRNAVANHFEDAWKWLGFTELRPTTMFSQARLRMERGEADPMTLMAMKVGEEREALEEEVTARVEAQEVPEAVEEVGEGGEVREQRKESKGVPLAQVPVETVVASKSRVQELIDEGKSRAEAERIAIEEAAGQVSEETSGESEGGLPASEQAALDESEDIEVKEIIQRLKSWVAKLESGDEAVRRQVWMEMAQFAPVLLEERKPGPTEAKSETAGKARKGEETSASKPEAGKAPAKEAPDWKTFLENRTAQEFMHRIGKNEKQLEEALDGLANGTISIRQFGEEFISKGERVTKRASRMRRSFYNLVKKELVNRGQEEGEIEEAELEELQKKMNRAFEESMDKDWSDEKKREFRRYLWMTIVFNTWDELKASVAKGMKEG